MLKLDALRLFVDQRLAAATGDIFRRFASVIAEYEDEVFRLKQEIYRQGRQLETDGGPEDGAGDGPAEEEVEEGGASGPEVTSTFTQCLLSNQIHSCSLSQSLKQEVDEGYMMLEAEVRAEISPQSEGALQVRGRSLSLQIKQEEGGASGPEETISLSPDVMVACYEDEGSTSSELIHAHRDEDLLPAHTKPLTDPDCGGVCIPADLNRDSGIKAEPFSQVSDKVQLEPGLQELLICSSCGREFSTKRTLKKHIKRNRSQDQNHMSCSLQRPRLPSRPSRSPPKSFSCRICGISFRTLGILVRHAENHCKEPESRCGACGDRLDSTKTLRDHLRSHKEVGSTCDVCGKKCKSMKTMEIHKRVHTGEKPYCCGLCSRDFSRKESLERHLRTHSGDRPHCCRVCRKTFTRREYLGIHYLKTGHTDRPGPAAGSESSSITL